MKSSILRALLTLTATGAIAAGYGEMPTASAATPVPSPSATPLSVFVTCGENYEVLQTCVAEASGGSGTGYTFTWETGKVKSTQGATSTATVNCPENSGYRYESVSVTDSNNAYAESQAQVWCSPW
ncbi:hypothetical protein [Longimicrobium sp.]|uniref:hypothetical protein n=1 Tax=Longimicrobium sp. TaxID=2029185 RepID=UPI002E31CB5B|nr:hypothetical protein [Longimicrobium sp.]HEX6038970.1 hypothetical protein [Longimicrobium sp.]